MPEASKKLHRSFQKASQRLREASRRLPRGFQNLPRGFLEFPRSFPEASRSFQLAIEICFWNHWERTILTQILARSLLEPDLGKLRLSSCLSKSISGNIGNGPFWAKSWPGAFWSQISTIYFFPAVYENLLLKTLGTDPFGPNPGQEIFGIRFFVI